MVTSCGPRVVGLGFARCQYRVGIPLLLLLTLSAFFLVLLSLFQAFSFDIPKSTGAYVSTLGIRVREKPWDDGSIE